MSWTMRVVKGDEIRKPGRFGGPKIASGKEWEKLVAKLTKGLAPYEAIEIPDQGVSRCMSLMRVVKKLVKEKEWEYDVYSVKVGTKRSIYIVGR